MCILKEGFPSGSEAKNLPANAGDMGQIPGSGRSLGEGNDTLLQYSCPGNPMTEELCGLESIVLEKVRHKFVSKQQKHSCIFQKMEKC